MTKLASSGIVMLQLLPHTSKQGTDKDTEKQLLPGTSKQGTNTDTIKQLLPLPDTSNQGTATNNSTDLAPVDHGAEAQGDTVTDAGPLLSSYEPARIVQQILEDLQAGRLSPPQ